MKAIILAGGKGTRLKDVIQDIPKPLAPVGEKPFLEYLILQLKKWKIDEIVLSVGYKKETIKTKLGDGSQFDVSITYCEENEPLGTGGALKKAISCNNDSDYIVMNGDSFFGINFLQLIDFHKSKKALATMALAVVKDKSRYGGVELERDGRVKSFQEKGLSVPGIINGGTYIISKNILDYIPDGQISLEGEVLPSLIRESLLYGVAFNTFFLDIGIPGDYFWANKHLEYLTGEFY